VCPTTVVRGYPGVLEDESLAGPRQRVSIAVNPALMGEAPTSCHSDQDGGGEFGTQRTDFGVVVQPNRGRALKQAMIDDRQQAVRRQANTFQVAQNIRIAIRDAAHNYRTAWRHGY